MMKDITTKLISMRDRACLKHAAQLLVKSDKHDEFFFECLQPKGNKVDVGNLIIARAAVPVTRAAVIVQEVE